jgi:hypothetical protein
VTSIFDWPQRNKRAHRLTFTTDWLAPYSPALWVSYTNQGELCMLFLDSNYSSMFILLMTPFGDRFLLPLPLVLVFICNMISHAFVTCFGLRMPRRAYLLVARLAPFFQRLHGSPYSCKCLSYQLDSEYFPSMEASVGLCLTWITRITKPSVSLLQGTVCFLCRPVSQIEA